MTLRAKRDGEGRPTNERLARIAALVVTLWALSVTMVVFWLSTFLRPIADDYVLGDAAAAGLLPTIIGWWNSWSGDLSLVVANTILVGIPLQHLPWTLATAVPFVVSGLVVAAYVTWLCASTRVGITGWVSPLRRVTIFSTTLVMWWAYWWVNATAADGAAYSLLLARGVTFWQNLNSQYVVTVALLIWALSWLETRSDHTWQRLSIGYLLWGLLAGMSGPVFALSSLSALLIVGVLRVLKAGWFMRSILWISAALGVIVGALTAHYSPGTQARAQLVALRTLNGRFLTDALAVSDDAVMDWWVGIYNPGTLAVMLILTVVGGLLGLLGLTFSAIRSTRLALTFLGFALFVILVNRFSELFSYEAWWHVITARTITWFGICLLGIALGSVILRYVNQSILIPLLALGGLVGVILTTAGFSIMANEVLVRERIWAVGPAPLEGMGDIESGSGWTESWLKLRDAKGGPARQSGG